MNKKQSWKIIWTSGFMIGVNVVAIIFWPVYIAALACCCELPMSFVLVALLGWLCTGGVSVAGIIGMWHNIQTERKYLQSINKTNNNNQGL